eukprot:364810-Chlamydomonas_euryale.AAC.3
MCVPLFSRFLVVHVGGGGRGVHVEHAGREGEGVGCAWHTISIAMVDARTIVDVDADANR